MIVEEMERRFFELKGKLDVGVVNEEEFKNQVAKLRFQDHTNRWWMIGAQSGKWYAYDGVRWIPGTPPADAPSPAAPSSGPSPTSQVVAPSAATRGLDLPPATPTPTFEPIVQRPDATRLVEPPAPLVAPVSVLVPDAPPRLEITPPPAAPPAPLLQQVTPAMPARRKVAPPKLGGKISLSGPIVILGAAVLALLCVAISWVLIDIFVPSKPISSFIAGLTGDKAAAASARNTPPVANQTPSAKEVPALIAAGDQLVVQSQMDSAITQYQNAATLAPTNATAFTRWSRALAFKGQMTDAFAKAQQAVKLAPNDAEAQAQLCRALAWNGQVDDAIVAGEKAKQLDAKNVNAYANLTEAYLLAKRTVDAQGAAYAALQIAPQSAEAHRAQAWVLTVLGQRDAALVEWKQTVTLEPGFYFRHFEYGEVLRTLGLAPEAVGAYQKAAGLYGAYIPAISRLGFALLQANKPQEAVAPLQRTITLDPNNAENYTYLAIAFGQTNRCTQAIPYFEYTLRLDANNALAQRGLADCKAGKPPTSPPPPPQITAPITPATLVPPKP